MIIANNYKNYNNNLQISINADLQAGNIITNITGRVNGFEINKKYYDFSKACEAFKKYEGEFGEISKY